MIFGKFRNFWKKDQPVDYDYLPLFFWDKSLSDTAKIIMCIATGGEKRKNKVMEQMRQSFDRETVDKLDAAIDQLIKYGYLYTENFQGKYGEPRVEKRLCSCPAARLPKLVDPTGGDLVLTRSAVEMYDVARDLGFIAETGKDTTYLLYDALRIFMAVEKVLNQSERVILPVIGIESRRKGVNSKMLLEYPKAVIAIIITDERVIILQEDCSVEGRQDGFARFVFKRHSEWKTVSLDEALGRVTFDNGDENDWDGRFSVDFPTLFALELFPKKYEEMMGHLPANSGMPRLTYFRENNTEVNYS